MAVLFDLPSGTTIAILIAAAAALFVVQWPVRRSLRWLLGPLFSAEVARLYRRGSTFWLRSAYPLVLFGAIFASFPRHGVIDAKQLAQFARGFTELFLLVQSIAVMLLTPIWFGGAISDEKERRSLDFLLTSQLSSREIVLSKYAARLLAVIAAMLAGLPVLILTLLWGGVDLARIGEIFSATILAMLSQAAICILFSVFSRTTVGAIVGSVIWTALMTCCCAGVALGDAATPIQFQLAHEPFDPYTASLSSVTPFDGLVRFGLVHGTMAMLALGIAIWSLRRRAGPQVLTPILIDARQDLNEEINGVSIARTPPGTLTFWHPVGRRAIVWMERHRPSYVEPASNMMWVFFAVLLAALSVPALVLPTEVKADLRLGNSYSVLMPVLAAGLSLGLLFHLSGAITRERERRTLESLLVVPESRWRILWEKWLGAVLRRQSWIVAIGSVFLIGVISGLMRPLAGLMMVVLSLTQAFVVSMIGLLATSVARKTVRARVAALAVILVILGISLFATGDPDSASWNQFLAHFKWTEALNPISAWELAFDLEHTRGAIARNEVAEITIGIGVDLLVAATIGAFAIWRFQRFERFD